MGAKKYLKNEFRPSYLNLEHDNTPDFYLGCWQNNRSCVPQLYLRGILCAINVAILIWSMLVGTLDLDNYWYWWIYLTDWGLVINVLTTIFAFAISLRVYFKGPIDGALGLRWYIKVYWFLYNASVPVAMLITIFYWSFIYGTVDATDPWLDAATHAANTVLMLVLVATSSHPSRLLHFYHAILFTLVYMTFSLIYYYAGGLDPNGNVWIYALLDWSNPGPTTVVVVGVTLGLVFLHALVVLITLCRNYFSQRFRKDQLFPVSG